ncbi:hypothetical protein [Actinacidiphila sp. bgisy145]|uniref:hypothetical protein n=1 Tax=Actinacidiphila sp. bgisy145 TaxID=3413792 RepID=UPI003EBF8D49
MLALCLGAGLAVWLTVPTHTKAPELRKAPFYLALDNLAAQPVVHYSGSAAGVGEWDLKVTSGGEELGTVSFAGQQIDILTVGGRTYVKPPQELLAGLPGDAPSSALKGQWITGDDTLSAALPKGLGTPAALADSLWAGLEKATDFPQVGDAPVVIGSDRAWRVTTPDGVLYVSAAKPYRVLRVGPDSSRAGGTPSSAAAADQRTPAGQRLPAAQPPSAAPLTAGRVAPAAAGGLNGLGRTNFAQMSPSDVDQTLGDLKNQTEKLKSAVDLGIQFDVEGQESLDCSDSSCTVTAHVTSTTTAGSASRVSGTVTARLTATVTVNGKDGGGCTGQATLPVNGSGTISCPDPEVAPIVAEIKEQAQEEANEEAEESGHDAEVPYTLDYGGTAEVWAEAVVQATVDTYVSGEQDEQSAADQWAKDNSDCEEAAFTGPAGADMEPVGLVARPVRHGAAAVDDTSGDGGAADDPDGAEACAGSADGLTDDDWNAIDDKYGPQVADGVDYNEQVMHGPDRARAASHTIPGIGHDPQALARYFAKYRNVPFTHVDSRIEEGASKAYAVYDEDKGVAIIKNSRMIHGYLMSPESFAKRFDPIKEGG